MQDDGGGGEGSGVPGRKKTSPWVWLLLGCFTLLVLAVGSCLSLGLWGMRSFQSSSNQDWERLRSLNTELQDDDGAARVWRREAALASAYPTEEAFLAAVTTWRPYLVPLPDKPPSIWSGSYHYNLQVQPGHRSVSLYYRNDRNAWIRVHYVNGGLQSLTVELPQAESTPAR